MVPETRRSRWPDATGCCDPARHDRSGQCTSRRSGSRGSTAQPPTDGFSIAALVFGIIGGVLLGVIFGFIGLSRTKGGQRKGRGLAIAGLVLSLVWVLAIGAVVVVALVTQPQRDAGGEVTTGGNETFAGVQVGDCANNLTEGVDTGVDLVPCSQPHQGQVFAIYDLPDGPYPGEDAAFSAAQSGCLVRVPAALGDAPEAQDLRTFVYFPQAANWSAGDRQVICAALSPTPMTGSLPGLP